MLVPLLIVVAALAAALAVLVARLRRLGAQADRARERLAHVDDRAAQAAAARRAALAPPAEAEPRTDAPDRRPVRRGRRATALPDRP